MPFVSSSAWSFAWTHLRPVRGLLFTAILWRVLFRLLPVQLPLLTGALIDGLNARPVFVWGWKLPISSPAETVFWLGIALASLALSTGLSAFFSGRYSGLLSRTATRNLRMVVLEAWQHAPQSFHRRYGASKLYNRTITEAAGLGKIAKDSFAEGTAAVVRFLYPAVMLVLIDPWMALFPLAALPLQVLLTRFFQNRQNPFTESIRDGKAGLTRTVTENLDGILTVQSLNAQQQFIQRIDREAEDLEEERDRSGAYSSLLTASVWALAALALAGSWWIGANRVVNGQISIGQLVAFAGFVSYLAVPLRRFARLAKGTQKSLNRLLLLDQLIRDAAIEHHPVPLQTLTPTRGHLVLQHLSYAIDHQPILHDVSGSIPAGQFTWIRGRSGAGKSTLLRLLARLDAPTSGSIFLDGQDLNLCTDDSVRRAIGLVPQTPMLFTGTIAENLRLAAPEATSDDLLYACQQAGFDTTLHSLPLGLRTQVGEGGRTLSGGEAQRLAIARVLLRQPRVLLLDEPTAALDPHSEAHLFATLAALCPRVTIVMVAHNVRSMHGIHHVINLEQVAHFDLANLFNSSSR